MIIICWDSLRLDATEPLKGILGEESWTDIPSIDGFTGPILPSIVCGKSPEDLGIARDDSAFWSGIDPKNIDDTLFDHFDDYITISRLIGPDTHPCIPLPPSRKGQMKFMPPIKWNAVSNWDVDIWKYVGKKWSIADPFWTDMIFYWTFITHGNFTIYDSLGAVESPEIKDGGRLMQNLARNNPDRLRELYMKGVSYAAETLKGINEICGENELIICFSDHNEALGEYYNGQILTGHFAGMHNVPGLDRVPLWINRPDVEFPENMTQLDLKDWIVKMYNKYEKPNATYNAFKNRIKGKL